MEKSDNQWNKQIKINNDISSLFLSLLWQANEKLCQKEKNLHSTDERESCQQSKCSSNSWQDICKGKRNIFGDLIIARSIKSDWDELKVVLPIAFPHIWVKRQTRLIFFIVLHHFWKNFFPLFWIMFFLINSCDEESLTFFQAIIVCDRHILDTRQLFLSADTPLKLILGISTASSLNITFESLSILILSGTHPHPPVTLLR